MFVASTTVMWKDLFLPTLSPVYFLGIEIDSILVRLETGENDAMRLGEVDLKVFVTLSTRSIKIFS